MRRWVENPKNDVQHASKDYKVYNISTKLPISNLQFVEIKADPGHFHTFVNKGPGELS